jgi:hypothetical protein
MMPPHIKTEYFQLRFGIIRAEKLPKMDTFGTIDAYVKCDYMGATMKTKVYT